MKVGDSFDLIVIGDQLSGLFLAAGAAQQGMRVLVLEESNFPTVLYEAPSGKFLGDFVAEPAIGIKEGSPVDSFLRSLGLYQDLDRLFVRHEPPLQVVCDGFRLDFEYGSNAFPELLSRSVSLPKDRLSALAGVLNGKLKGKGKFSQAIAGLELPVEYEWFGSLQAALYGSLLPEDIENSDYLELCRECSKGIRFPLGGRGALKQHLIGRLSAFGGSLRRSSHVEQLVFERKKLAGVLLSSYEGFVRSRRVVGAMAAASLAKLLPAEMKNRGLEEAVREIRPKGWKLGFTLLVPDSVIPEGMGSHIALMDLESDSLADGLLQLQVFPKDFYGGIPPKHRAILGRIILPFDERSVSPRAISVALKVALHRVERLIPFLQEQPFSMYPDPRNLESDPVFQKYYRFPDPSHIPGSLLVYEKAFGDRRDTLSSLDWTSFGLPGLALCSRDIRPLEGVFGEILSAMELLEVWKKQDKIPGKARPKRRGVQRSGASAP